MACSIGFWLSTPRHRPEQRSTPILASAFLLLIAPCSNAPVSWPASCSSWLRGDATTARASFQALALPGCRYLQAIAQRFVRREPKIFTSTQPASLKSRSCDDRKFHRSVHLYPRALGNWYPAPPARLFRFDPLGPRRRFRHKCFIELRCDVLEGGSVRSRRGGERVEECGVKMIPAMLRRVSYLRRSSRQMKIILYWCRRKQLGDEREEGQVASELQILT